MQPKQNKAQTRHDKVAIGRTFGRAATSYDSHAELQRLVGERLLTLAGPVPLGRVLDLGCGSGHFTEKLTHQGHQLIALDLASPMLKFTRLRCPEALCLQGDADALPLGGDCVDMVFSSLALQWSQDLTHALIQLKRSVRPGGRILISTLAEGSLGELAQAWHQVDSQPRVNRFLSEESLRIAVASAGLNPAQLSFETVTLHYDSSLAVMRALKGVGATHLHQGDGHRTLNRHTLAALERAYQTLASSPKQLPLSYRVCYGVFTLD
ncbi:malonyl-ACP O-methyltransferase BioC [Ferrimonas sp. YFM]|uniref:malonyl-ACP O-methyltransferase BioC n=1 Tax=Ferrimonas sp. YFM TaxID=3028878 RepID=UPI00257434E1|nr:malonyl-ACP O-methyltransferase BioC [Ferrimonas sp. YFM]BDY05613.1 biotin synthesis protein BioC [Ferrimonas sp. YFM]